MFRPILCALSAALLLAACEGGSRENMTASTCGTVPNPSGMMNAASVFIGPDLPKWGNQSPGMPTHPTPAEGGGWHFDVPIGVDRPLETGPRKSIPKVDYVTFNHGPLSGKTQIRLRYRLDLEPGAEVRAVPEQDPLGRWPALMTVYFQRKGDNWSAQGRYDTYRWYASAHDVKLEAGEYQLVVPLNEGWTSANRSTDGSAVSANPTLVPDPAGFNAAKADTGCVGIVFGGNEVGRSHGMRATGPARFTLLDFKTE